MPVPEPDLPPRLDAVRRGLADATVGATIVAADGMRLRWANDAFCAMVGRPLETIAGRDVRALGDLSPDAHAEVERVYRGEQAAACLHRRYIRPDGGAVWARISVTPLGDGLFLGVSHDVTAERASAEVLHRLVEHAPVAILSVARDGRIALANPESERLLGYPPGGLVGLPVEDLVPQELRAEHPKLREGYNRAPEVRRIGHGRDVRAVRADGAVLTVEASLNPIGDGATQVVLVDVTERKRAERELERRASRERAIAGLGERALAGETVRELEQLACEHVVTHLGVEISKVLEPDAGGRLIVRAGVGLGTTAPVGGTLPVEGTHAGLALLRGGDPLVIEDIAAHPGITDRSLLRALGVRSSAVVALGGLDAPLGVLGAHTRTRRTFTPDDLTFLKTVANVLADAIRHRRAEAAIRHQALHDTLTGLPNRVLLAERIGHWRQGAGDGDRQTALLCVDIDGFKRVNDALGHHAGDDLLRAIGPRLRHAVRPRDTVARLESGTFAVLCEDLGAESDAREIAERIAQAFAAPFTLVGGHRQCISLSIGIAMSGRPPLDAGTLLQNAEIAMHRAKAQGPAAAVTFVADMHQQHVRRLGLERDLRAAVADGDIAVRFQPIVDLETGAPAGFEALARWTQPGGHPIPPPEFIGIAEEAGFVAALSSQVLRKAAWQAVGWGAAGHADLYVSVNLSTRQVTDLATVDLVRDVLSETRLAPRRLALEMTETAILGDVEAAGAVITRLRDLGVRVKLDDFGTGYSSLSHVQRLPVDCLKVDRAFVTGSATARSSRAIVAAVLQVADGIDAIVVAEGVETLEDHETVRALGCRYAQGYRYARPMPAAEVGALLAGRTRA